MKPWAWDYDLPDDWQPKSDEDWVWFLVRKINYEDLDGLRKPIITKYFPDIARFLDPGKRALFAYYLGLPI